MNYLGKKIAITGADGFIGSALAELLAELVQPVKPVTIGAALDSITVLHGDIRHQSTFRQLDHTYDYLFHFAAPSSQVQFARDPNYCIETTVKGFINVTEVCRKNGIRLIYPSTGLLSQDRYNAYAMCKSLCEQMARDIDALGVRIFATYGPGEGHKRDYASVPYLFARDMVNGKEPLIFGTGKQSRDFIYIDDVVNAIAVLAEECSDRVIDLGSGVKHTFNYLVHLINDIGKFGIEADYAPPPKNYVEETAADPTRLYDFYRPRTHIRAGLQATIKELEELIK